MQVPPNTRRANRWLLIALIVFCIGLCAACLLWMRVKTAADGGKVYPPLPGTPPPTAKSEVKMQKSAGDSPPFFLETSFRSPKMPLPV